VSAAEPLAEALRGWRAWQVVDGRDGPGLISWLHGTAWPTRRALEAVCNRHGGRPSLHHSCGIYAFDDCEEALAYVEQAPRGSQLFVRRPDRARGIAVGAVSGWGRAVRHARGWRSQFAYPYDLYLVGGDHGLARELADRYAVETSPFHPTRQPRSP
jgi:hypothetical protein